MKGMRIVLPSRAPLKSSSPIYYQSISRELYPHLDPISFVQLRCPESPRILQCAYTLGQNDEPATRDVKPALAPDFN